MVRKPFRGSWLKATANRPSVWLLVALFLLITVLQYAKFLGLPSFLANLTANLGLTRYSLERILYLLPIMWAAFSFGWRGGTLTAFLVVICMLPRAVFISTSREDALVETGAVFALGTLVSYSLESLRKERYRRSQLESVEEQLRIHLQALEANQKRLDALNNTSSIISQSLQLPQVLESAIDCVVDVMGAEAVLMYTLDEAAGELTLAAYRGVAEMSLKGIDRLKVGEGFNGRVAETGESLLVEDASEDPRLTKCVVREENLRSQLIVPLRSKGKVVGTVCVAMRSRRTFLPEEVDLLRSIGNQIGAAVGNARLYEEERQVAGELRASEERHRELFQSAHDAIWLHDLDGNILTANRACVRLTGYSIEELRKLSIIDVLAEESREIITSIKQRLIRGDTPGSLGEVKLVRKDGSQALVQLASSLVFSNGQPVAVQHVGRDVTESRRMQENLHFLLRQITRAQEEERRRIARELHDDTIQALVVHSQQLYDLAHNTKGLPEDAIHRLTELREQANVMMQELRRLSQDLRPAGIDRLGLMSALRRLAKDAAEDSGIIIEVKVIGAERRLPSEVELVLFRIAQEGLRNVLKHSRATLARITVQHGNGTTRLTVSDNGKGFDAKLVPGDLPRHGKLGLAGMEERARLLGGTFTIESEPGKGTTLTVELPA